MNVTRITSNVRAPGAGGRLARGGVILVLTTGAVAGLAVNADAVVGFHTSASSIRVRSGASTLTTQISTVTTSGTAIDIACQVAGQAVTAAGFGTSTVWDKLNGYGNGYISDLFVQETTYAQFDSRIPRCPATPTTAPSPTTARSIGYNPFAARFSSQCTYYAEERMHSQTGRYMPVYGHAYQWAAQARAAGWTVGTTPAVNAVAVFPIGAFGSNVGHVAWVVGLTPGRLHIQDRNWYGAMFTDHWVNTPANTSFIYSDR